MLSCLCQPFLLRKCWYLYAQQNPMLLLTPCYVPCLLWVLCFSDAQNRVVGCAESMLQRYSFFAKEGVFVLSLLGLFIIFLNLFYSCRALVVVCRWWCVGRHTRCTTAVVRVVSRSPYNVYDGRRTITVNTKRRSKYGRKGQQEYNKCGGGRW